MVASGLFSNNMNKSSPFKSNSVKLIFAAATLQFVLVWSVARAQQYSHFIIDEHADNAGNVFSQSGSSAAFDGKNYMVVFADDRDSYKNIYGARINPEGTVLDPHSFIIGSGICGDKGFTDVAFGSETFLVVWQDSRYYKDLRDGIYGTLVNREGVASDTAGFLINNHATDQQFPKVCYGNSLYLVVWQEVMSDTASAIYGARMSADGTVLDSDGILISYGQNASAPAIAFDGNNFLVVWISDSTVYGARVGQDGVLHDQSPVAISSALGAGCAHPAVAFDGAAYLVAWQDAHNGNADVYAARLSTTGAVLDQLNIPVSTHASNQRNPSVIFDGVDFLVVWEDDRNAASDLYGARVSIDGQVYPELNLVTNAGESYGPGLAHGAGNQVLLHYTGSWQVQINDQMYGAERIWCSLLNESQVGIEEMSLSPSVQTYPNPCHDVLHLMFKDDLLPAEASVLNLLGEEVKRIHISSGDNFIPVSDLDAGIYFCKLIGNIPAGAIRFEVQH